MSAFYANAGKLYATDYMEIYIPMNYFKQNLAVNKGSSIELFGIVYTRTFKNGSPNKIQLLNTPVVIDLMIYEFKQETIELHGSSIDVMTLEYLKDAYVLHQTVQKGREVAEAFLSSVLAGKLPKTLKYQQLIDLWWRNLEISGISFKVPSKEYEMILATIYRNPGNVKERYGQHFGRQSNPTGLDYKTGNVREVVKNLSTFSGMVFEDMGAMISNGIINSIDDVEEPVSPLEKIIHY